MVTAQSSELANAKIDQVFSKFVRLAEGIGLTVGKTKDRSFGSGAVGKSIDLLRSDDGTYVAGVTYLPQDKLYACQIIFKSQGKFVDLLPMSQVDDLGVWESEVLEAIREHLAANPIQGTNLQRVFSREQTGLSSVRKGALIALGVSLVSLSAYGLRRLFKWVQLRSKPAAAELKTAWLELRKNGWRPGRKIPAVAKAHLVRAVRSMQGQDLRKVTIVVNKLRDEQGDSNA